MRGMLYTYEDRRGGRVEGLYLPKSHVELLGAREDIAEELDRLVFASAQRSGRENGDVGRRMRVVRMKVLPHGLDEVSKRIPDVRDQRVLRAARVHLRRRLYSAYI